MRKLAITLGVCAVLALVASAQAGGLKGNSGKVGIMSDPEGSVGLGECFSGNTEGDKAWEDMIAQKMFQDLPGMTAVRSGGESGAYLDLEGWNCTPDYLVIKGGDGYVVLDKDALAAALLNDSKVYVSETCLVNGGGKAPAISHWAAYGCKSVPEPSSVLASLGALAFGAFMLRRRHTA